MEQTRDSNSTNTKSPVSALAQTLAIPLLVRLKDAVGDYVGEGFNHEGERFTAKLSLRTELSDAMATIQFRAVDGDNAFHEERTWITEDLLRGGLVLCTVSTNTPGLLELKLVEDCNDGSYSTKAVFLMGDRADQTRFREQITLAIRHDGAIEYAYSWGVPHQEFAERSKALLRRN